MKNSIELLEQAIETGKELVNNTTGEAKAAAKKQLAADKKALIAAKAAAARVNLVFKVTQVGKTPFTMVQETSAPAGSVCLMGLSRKTAFALATGMQKQAERAIKAKEQTGKYLTSFRPKAVFQVEILVNNQAAFIAHQTKGIDAIRLFDNKGAIDTRLIVAKFELLAGMVEASAIFQSLLQFESEVETLTAELTAETEQTINA
jgi:hypothetical protein